jgi:hypothetical protein
MANTKGVSVKRTGRPSLRLVIVAGEFFNFFILNPGK